MGVFKSLSSCISKYLENYLKIKDNENTITPSNIVSKFGALFLSVNVLPKVAYWVMNDMHLFVFSASKLTGT